MEKNLRKQASNYPFENALYEKWLVKRGFSSNYDQVLTATKGRSMFFVSKEEAIRKQKQIHQHINPGTPSKKTRYGNWSRMGLNDLNGIMNFGFDAESPDHPDDTFRVMVPWVKSLSRAGWMPKGQDIETTKAGGHIVVGVKFIKFSSNEDRMLKASAIDSLFENVFIPEWNGINDDLGLKIKLTCCDLSHPFAPAGTVRFAGNKETDCLDLRLNNQLRDWYFITDWERRESKKSRDYITSFSGSQPKSTEEFYRMQIEYSDDMLESIFADALVWYSNERITADIDRSTRMCKLLHFAAKEFNWRGEEFPREMAMLYAVFINNLCGRPHATDKEAVRQAQYILSKWKPLIRLKSFENQRKYNTDIILAPKEKPVEINANDEQKQAFHAWSDTFICLDIKTHTPIEKMLFQYQQWCSRTGVEAVGEKQFSIIMGQKYKALKKLKTVDGVRCQCYLGISMQSVSLNIVHNNDIEIAQAV